MSAAGVQVTIRATVANITPQRLARAGQAAGLSGTVEASRGFGAWGVEAGATVELSGVTRAKVKAWLQALLKARKEEAAYLTINGANARLLYATGKEVKL